MGEKHEIHHLARRLTWSPVKPSTAGWYWHRGSNQDSTPIVVEIDEAGYFQWPDGTFDEVKVTGGEWAGPIQEPEEQDA